MAHRLVPTEYAKSAADAEAYVVSDTGGQVIPITGKTQEVEVGWRVDVYSTDGRASMPLPHGAVFPKDNRMSDAEIQKQINQFGSGEEKGWTLGTATGRGFRK
jgi:hypothetical protein